MVPTGRKSYLLHPTPADYRLDEIAWHAGGVNRYTGGSRLSIAQHMLVGALMADQFYPDNKLLPHRFLIHDIAETKLGDVSSPLKAILGDSYRELEAQHDLVIEEKFGVTFLGIPEVKELDDRMWLTERLVVYRDALDKGVDISEDTRHLDIEPFPLPREELDMYFKPWGADKASTLYLMALLEAFGPRRETN